jgi:hypothetical protein
VNYWKVIFATAVIFGAGVFTGGLLVNMVRQSSSHAASHHPSPPSTSPGNGGSPSNNTNSSGSRLPGMLGKGFLPKLDDQVHLSSGQYTNIEKIIANAQVQTRKLMQDTRQQISAELTPDQRGRYDELMKPPGGPRRNGGTNAVESLMWTNPPATPVPGATNLNR